MRAVFRQSVNMTDDARRRGNLPILKEFLLRSMMERPRIRKRMQTLFHYMMTRRQQLVNVCLVTVLLLLSQENASLEYTCTVCVDIQINKFVFKSWI